MKITEKRCVMRAKVKEKTIIAVEFNLSVITGCKELNPLRHQKGGLQGETKLTLIFLE